MCRTVAVDTPGCAYPALSIMFFTVFFLSQHSLCCRPFPQPLVSAHQTQTLQSECLVQAAQHSPAVSCEVRVRWLVSCRPLGQQVASRGKSHPFRAYREMVSTPFHDSSINLRVLFEVASLPTQRGRRWGVRVHFVDSVQRSLHLQVILLCVCAPVRIVNSYPLGVVHCKKARCCRIATTFQTKQLNNCVQPIPYVPVYNVANDTKTVRHMSSRGAFQETPRLDTRLLSIIGAGPIQLAGNIRNMMPRV